MIRFARGLASRAARVHELKRKALLAEPAKRQRVLTKCDYWLGRDNLPQDRFILDQLTAHDGWMPVHALLQFPTLQHWVSARTIIGALTGRGASRYELLTRDGVDLFRPVKLGRYITAAREELRQAATEEEAPEVAAAQVVELAAASYGGSIEQRAAAKARGRRRMR